VPIGWPAPALRAGNRLLLVVLPLARRVDADPMRHVSRGTKRLRTSPHPERGDRTRRGNLASADFQLCDEWRWRRRQPPDRHAWLVDAVLTWVRTGPAGMSWSATCRKPAHATDGQRRRRR